MLYEKLEIRIATKTRRHKEKKFYIKNPSCLCVFVAKKMKDNHHD
jgi:hypothetical protein